MSRPRRTAAAPEGRALGRAATGPAPSSRATPPGSPWPARTRNAWPLGIVGLAVVLALLPPSAMAAPASSPQQPPGITALRSGRYEEAIDALEARVSSGEATVAEERALVEAFMTVGRHDEAEAVARGHAERHPGSVELAGALASVLRATGRRDEAEAALLEAVEGDATDRLSAEVELGVLRYERGERDAAMAIFDRFIDYYNRGVATSPADLTAVGVACRYLGIDNHALFQDAVMALDRAVDGDPGYLDARILMGELFLDKYDSGEASTIFSEVLELNPRHPDALLGHARRLDFDGDPEAGEVLDQALEINPDHVGARVFRARLLLVRERYSQAADEASRALEVNPTSLPALSMLATARFLERDEAGFAAVRDQVLELNPRHADLYNTLAELCVMNRLYQQAVEFARTAVELDPSSWWGHGQLGLNLLRAGEIETGRASLETAFEGDPYNVWIKNTLDLLDTFADYETVATDRFLLMIEGPEADLLAPYVTDVAEAAYDDMAARYGYRPPTPIRIEVYPSHPDFSVRTVGLAGLGALGVSFGPVIAIDSPSARPPGDFNWGSTLWHEIGHTFTLQMTDFRIPRWLSEGLSVHAERRSRPAWGDDVSPGFLIAHLQDRLLPVSRLSEGFVRPRYPEQIIHSYYQAFLVCELIEEQWGWDTVLALLDRYRQGDRTGEAFEAALGISVEELDGRFVDFLEARYAGPLAALAHEAASGGGEEGHGDPPAMARMRPPSPADLQRAAAERPDDFVAQLRWGATLVDEGRHDEAVEHLERARELFPGYAGADSPHWFLSRIAAAEGDAAALAEHLGRMTDINEKHYGAHLELAAGRREVGDLEGAAEALERSLYIYPMEMEPHRRLAGLYDELGDAEGAVREYGALVALEPVDRAEALFHLARALRDAGRRDEAKRRVLAALEIAPGYADAQDLLLELVGGDERR